MNRLLLAVTIGLILCVPQVWGATSQYPNPYRQTMWNTLTDNIHTVGQNPQQAKLTKMRLHQARTKARLNSIRRANQAKAAATPITYKGQ